MTAARWTRLADDLTAAGFPATVIEQPYTELVSGRPRHGVSRGIILRHPAGGKVEIDDQWWAKNPDIWTGWSVTYSGPDSITRSATRSLKKRSQVISAVRGALS